MADEPSPSPFHAGERAVQERLGVTGVEARARRMVRSFMPEQHRAFFGELPFLVVAARDGRGRPWATLLAGQPGFVSSPGPASLRIAARPAPGDALDGAMGDGSAVGILGIMLASRRRNRVNGRVARDGDAFVLAVDQSFGNCRRFIRERAWRPVDTEPGPVARDTALDAHQRRWIAAADTFFTASGYDGDAADPRFGMDASHRGGEPGFVRVSPTRIVFPDYAGNDHHNTIGNLVVDPRVGLTFVDFAAGSLLQITGRATIDWDSSEVATFPGAERLVVIDVDEVVELPSALPLRWHPIDPG